jgi:hypothetical protein
MSKLSQKMPWAKIVRKGLVKTARVTQNLSNPNGPDEKLLKPCWAGLVSQKLRSISKTGIVSKK